MLEYKEKNSGDEAVDQTFGLAIERAENAIKALNAVALEQEGSLPELFREEFAPDLMAQILMNEMNGSMGTFDLNRKVYWLSVGSHMGPDWVAQFRMIGAFMEKTDDFKSVA